MSIIFGMRNAVEELIEQRELLELAQGTVAWAPEGTYVRAKGCVGMGFQPSRAHRRSILESHPAVDGLGNMLTLDGRLDNHGELCELLGIEELNTADSQIALAAFRRWGEECFSRLSGDWALSLWSERDRIVYLARDHAGSRTLYYKQGKACIVWSTYLDSFTTSRMDLQVSEDFALRYMACYPLEHDTPYKGIYLVKPAHYIVIGYDSVTPRRYWSPWVRTEIRYQTDLEYEEHFFHVFRQSLLRRTDMPEVIIAELSGGMDSTAIVSMADCIANHSDHPQEERFLRTISYYRSGESTWDERPYFEETERTRGRKGIHVEIPAPQFDFSHGTSYASMPGTDKATLLKERAFEASIGEAGYRVILSGHGGDELLGGVPTPMPELADYLARGQLSKCFRSSLDWALASRRPLHSMVSETIRYGMSLYPHPSQDLPIPPWLLHRRQIFRSAGRNTANGRPSGMMNYFPKTISNALAWLSALETLPHLCPRVSKRYEFRYPFLDKDLVEFLLAVPRTQILRPGQRRSLMKRSLAKIMPRHILERRRKGFIAGGLVRSIQQQSDQITEYLRKSILVDLELIELPRLLDCVNGATTRSDVEWCRHIQATIAMEQWLQSLTHARNHELELTLKTYSRQQRDL